MAVLKFSLDPASLGKLHDALVCLGRFHESVCLEATRDHVILSSLNSTKTGYAAFTLIGGKFFTKYVYSPPRNAGKVIEKFTCRIYNKALQSVFRARTTDPSRERDTGIDKCEVSIEDGGEVKSRFVVQMTCRHGVLKTYHLTFEAASSMHAVFKSQMTRNVWSMSSHQLAANAGHFGPRTEQLDIYSENGKAIFTSYTEKVVAGKEVLKQPLTTSISISTSDFSHFRVDDQLHIIISVKDFKTIIAHASILDTEVTASYSHPSKPMQIKYSDDALRSEFILMTLGDYRSASVTPQPAANPQHAQTQPRVRAQPQQLQQQSSTGMRPPPSMSMAPMGPPPSMPRSATANVLQQTPNTRMPPTPATHQVKPLLEEDSLFVDQGDPEEDEDQQWNPTEEDEEMLTWDSGVVYEESTRIIAPPRKIEKTVQQMAQPHISPPGSSTQRLAPTQKMSQVHGMFDGSDDEL